LASRISQFKKAYRTLDLDGFLVTHPVNRNYLSHFTGSSGYLVFSLKNTWFLTDSRYTTQARQEVKDAVLVLQTRSPLSHITELVQKGRVRRLGFEAAHVTVDLHNSLAKALPKVKLVPTTGLIEGQRIVKDPDEKAVMRRAAAIADHTFAHILGRIRPGVRERELAAEMEHAMRLEGASGPSFDTIVASGWRAALPHGIASDKKIAKGDLVVLDFGCIYKHYCSDMTRTVSVGRPSAEQKKVYAIVQQAQASASAWVKEGRTCGEVDLKARDAIKAAGYGDYFGHGLGHGVGMEVHEEPRLGPKAPLSLKPGMAVTVEPGIYLPGKFGVRIEDLLLVTKTGSENLYQTTHDLIVV
jgi:Xaa-Pro aminopeptidase